MRKIVSMSLVAGLLLSSGPSASSSTNLQTSYLTKLKASLKASAKYYADSQGFEVGKRIFTTNPAGISEQINRIRTVCKLYDYSVKNKISSNKASQDAASTIFEVELESIDTILNDGGTYSDVTDYEFVQTSALSVGVSVYCKSHLTKVKMSLIPLFNKFLDNYLAGGSSSVLDQPAADFFNPGSALVTLNQVWRISLNGSNGPKTLREVTDEIYSYLGRALGRRANEQDITVGFQSGNSMHTFFTRLVNDADAYESIKERLIYNARN
jgi:hypothetical protein